MELVVVNVLLGIGLAMDALSVSIADGLNFKLNAKLKISIPVVFGIFQGVMPLIGYILISEFIGIFNVIDKYIPLLACMLLCYIGLNMIMEKKEEQLSADLSFKVIIFQAIATSVDALSVGLTLINYHFSQAFLASFIIATITFIICFIGINVTSKIQITKANLLGGIILILIGLKILL